MSLCTQIINQMIIKPLNCIVSIVFDCLVPHNSQDQFENIESFLKEPLEQLESVTVGVNVCSLVMLLCADSIVNVTSSFLCFLFLLLIKHNSRCCTLTAVYKFNKLNEQHCECIRKGSITDRSEDGKWSQQAKPVSVFVWAPCTLTHTCEPIL